ncbi:MAG: hypothetical protein JW787_11180 [Sedimentisphaerales bacterium]|nr:hypothetical protein [Sedimentisphaerales bacterium]
MKNEMNTANQQQELNRLCREPERLKETSILSSPGTGTSAWMARIQQNIFYNIYNVVNILIGSPGSEPTAMGIEAQAINLAEPFGQQGTLSSGTYVIIFRIGSKYVFYTKP